LVKNKLLDVDPSAGSNCGGTQIINVLDCRIGIFGVAEGCGVGEFRDRFGSSVGEFDEIKPEISGNLQEVIPTISRNRIPNPRVNLMKVDR
jgi:hypothetical protein